MTPATSGPEWRTPFAFYDPEASCWRTSQATFLSDSDLFSETWPRSGMTRAGFAYELPMPALPTADPESSSLLPTPAVNDMGAAYTPDEWDAWTARMQEKHGNGNGHGKSLAIEAQRLLPTPTTQDAANTGGPSQMERNSLPLNTLVTLLPTPEASDSTGGRVSAVRGGTRPSGAKRSVTLATALHHDLLPTPRATDGEKGGPNQRGSSGDLMLPSAVQQFTGAPTPPPSTAGSVSAGDQLPGQLSLDGTESD